MEQQQISSDLIRGHIDTIILYTLVDGDKFAEQISIAIEEKSQNAYKINQATLYSALKRLENLKYLSSYQQDVAGGGRRKFFTLTESGKKCIDENLSSWSFSRAIIDKLIGCEMQPVIKTEYVEKIVQIPVEKQVIVEKIIEKPVLDNKKTIENSDLALNQTSVNESAIEKQNEGVEVNFRSVLSGLIQTCNANNKKNEQENVKLTALEKTEMIEPVKEVKEVKKLHQTINEKEVVSIKRDIAEIDFSDLKIQALKEGYKLKISSKNSSSDNGTLLKNKLNLFTSLAMFLIFISEILFYSVVYKSVLAISPIIIFALIAFFAIFPIKNIFAYRKKPILTTNKSISSDFILTTAIVVFNLLIINFALVLLLNIDFAILKDVLVYIAIPFTLYIDIFIYSIIKYYLAKLKDFNLIRK